MGEVIGKENEQKVEETVQAVNHATNFKSFCGNLKRFLQHMHIFFREFLQYLNKYEVFTKSPKIDKVNQMSMTDGTMVVVT